MDDVKIIEPRGANKGYLEDNKMSLDNLGKGKKEELLKEFKYHNKFKITRDEFHKLTGETEEFYNYFLLVCYIFKDASSRFKDYVYLTRDFIHGIQKIEEFIN